MNFEILKTELQNSAYLTMNNADAATELNAVLLSVKQKISTHDVKAYLLISGKWNAVKKDVTVEAEDFVDVINSMESVDFNLAGVEVRVTSILDSLVTASLLSAADRTYIISLSDKTISRAEQLGLPVLNPENINHARSL